MGQSIGKGYRPLNRVFDARTERFGRRYEDFEIGDLFHHWPGKTITEAENNFFCHLTLATSPIHNDRNYAQMEMSQGKNLIVGTYIYALLTGMSVPDISGAARASLEVKNLRHLLPSYPGDTIYGKTTVIEKRESKSNPNQGIVTVETTGTNQNGEVICVFERVFLVPKRETR